MQILVLGASGMAGHTIALYLYEAGHDVTALTRKPFDFLKNVTCDVTDFATLERIIKDGKFDAIINCVGILNQFAENNPDQAILLNAYLPHFLAKTIKNTKTKLIQMSTDCVFSGRRGTYNEASIPDGETYYDRTKALGEVHDSRNLTFRNSIVGPDMYENGIGLFNWFMKQNAPIGGYTKAVWTGVTTLTLAKAMDAALETNLSGLYNLVNNDTISKYELLGLFNKYFKDGKLQINENHDFICDKSLVNTRKDFPFIVPSYEIMVQEMHEWIISHQELYPHYF